jgi:hypothetical protein
MSDVTSLFFLLRPSFSVFPSAFPLCGIPLRFTSVFRPPFCLLPSPFFNYRLNNSNPLNSLF